MTVEWDPFAVPTVPPANPFSNGAKKNSSSNDDWEDFNPRPVSTPTTNPAAPADPFGNVSLTNSTGSNGFSGFPSQTPISNPDPFISNTVSITPTPNTTNIPTNLFKSTGTNNPATTSTPSLSGFSNPPKELPKTTQTGVSPAKSNDPWAASHLFNNLSIGTASPNKPNTNINTTNPLTGGAKPLGATVGAGWPVPTTVPPVVYTTYPPTTYPVTYSYPPPTNTIFTNPTSNYSNTSQWGI